MSRFLGMFIENLWLSWPIIFNSSDRYFIAGPYFILKCSDKWLYVISQNEWVFPSCHYKHSITIYISITVSIANDLWNFRVAPHPDLLLPGVSLVSNTSWCFFLQAQSRTLCFSFFLFLLGKLIFPPGFCCLRKFPVIYPRFWRA